MSGWRTVILLCICRILGSLPYSHQPFTSWNRARRIFSEDSMNDVVAGSLVLQRLKRLDLADHPQPGAIVKKPHTGCSPDEISIPLKSLVKLDFCVVVMVFVELKNWRTAVIGADECSP